MRNQIQMKLADNVGGYRSEKEISTEEQRLLDIVWLVRHSYLKKDGAAKKVDPDIWKGALEHEKRVLKRLGLKSEKDHLHFSDFEWGMINGKTICPTLGYG